MHDLISGLVAATETTSHALTSFLYYVEKNPIVKQKLQEELRENGFIKGDKFKEHMTLENIQNLTYLNCCVKETLRIDSPVLDTFDYVAYEDVEICEVAIPKGTKMKIDISTPHFDSSKWADPFKFVPERHDVEFEFSKMKPNDVVPDTYSRRAFSHGLRNCPGMSLALLEIKVFMIYFFTHTNVKFEETDLQN
eukprot:CAMPEP_0205802154 /NCGR_PEP_ID=MMETSP0205-20121125/4382_1 /ASSEMBLY_ACC=CAM_ASM_000278 /TAXON_ID=36767 /ORGANISM="Euplotes focardii, Strain TN1" /LENGTH=193 /DNA_ID=CAMNT_0053068097 /DNA_START=768 /DNA_END=1346 /DNA_ORIENTATION=+